LNRALFFFVCCLAGLLAASLYQFRDNLKSSLALLIHGNSVSTPSLARINTTALNTLSFSRGIEDASPSVVSIYTVVVNTNSKIDPSAGTSTSRPVDNTSERQANQGSGVIIDPSGLIVTSDHLIESAEKIYIALSSGSLLEAKVIGRDRETDLALLSTEPQNPLPAFDIKLSEDLLVGDVVLAIGNPYGVGQTVTLGIVSAIRRKLTGISPLQNFVQIDAAINPGNSGGALISPSGMLMGINTAVFSRLDGAQGIGFAIPTKVVREVVPQLIEHGRVIRGWLGLAIDDLINYPSLIGSTTHGAVVVAVGKGGPAEAAGIQAGDILIAIDGQAITRSDNLLTDIAATQPGDTVMLRLRRGELEVVLEVSLAERPQSLQQR